MTLWQDVANTRAAIKHIPEQVDLDDVRALLGRVQDALDVLTMLTFGADISTYSREDDGRWAVTVHAVTDDRRPLDAWMADQ